MAQADLIRECYTNGQIDITQTAYVEAHGTGTPVGDPLEISAISAAFQPLQTQPLLVGSIKANIGHTEAVSGLASIIKTVMSLEKRSILPNARFLRPSKQLLLDKRHIKVRGSQEYRTKYLASLTHSRSLCQNRTGHGAEESVAHRYRISVLVDQMLSESNNCVGPHRFIC